MSRTSLVVGNWKMNGTSESARQLLSDIARDAPDTSRAALAVCVPFPYLEATQRRLLGTRIEWGAQAISEFEGGAHTGEVSAAMLQDFGCRYVLVGHSERRVDNGETDLLVGLKTRAALRSGLTPIICVGESSAERESGSTAPVVLRQLDAAISGLTADQLRRCVIAYEPVWAIGAGLTASPRQAAEVHACIRGHIAAVDKASAAAIRILYGGSVKPSSAALLFAQPGIDGGLIGGASLIAKDFLAIAAALPR